MADETFGLSFSPTDEKSKRVGAMSDSQTPFQDAIRVLRLRLPRVVGASAPAPGSLLSGPGSVGLLRFNAPPMMVPGAPQLPGSGPVPAGLSLEELLRRLFAAVGGLPPESRIPPDVRGPIIPEPPPGRVQLPGDVRGPMFQGPPPPAVPVPEVPPDMRPPGIIPDLGSMRRAPDPNFAFQQPPGSPMPPPRQPMVGSPGPQAPPPWQIPGPGEQQGLPPPPPPEGIVSVLESLMQSLGPDRGEGMIGRKDWLNRHQE